MQVDLEQLDVQLGRGTLELRGVLLNCDYLNEQLVGSQEHMLEFAVEEVGRVFSGGTGSVWGYDDIIAPCIAFGSNSRKHVRQVMHITTNGSTPDAAVDWAITWTSTRTCSAAFHWCAA